jgi:hemerythrin
LCAIQRQRLFWSEEQIMAQRGFQDLEEHRAKRHRTLANILDLFAMINERLAAMMRAEAGCPTSRF